MVAFAEKGLLSEGVLDHDLRIVIDEISRSVSVSLLY